MAIDGENAGAAGAGSIADMLGAAGSAGAGEAGAGDVGGETGGAGGAGAGGEAGAAGAGDGGIDPDWYGGLSADAADGENSSNRDWVKAKGFKALDDIVKAHRATERAFHDSGRVKVPGEGAKPEEIAAFHKAIGVPDDASGYAMPVIKDASGADVELDTPLVQALAETALKTGVPKAAFEGLLQDFVAKQLDAVAEGETKAIADANAVVKAWGADSDVKSAAVNRAAEILGIDSEKMVGLRNALGADFALNMLAKLGAGLSEDVMVPGGKTRFGIGGAEAQAEMNTLKSDAEFQRKVMVPGSPERARWNRLQDAVAAHQDQLARAG